MLFFIFVNTNIQASVFEVLLINTTIQIVFLYCSCCIKKTIKNSLFLFRSAKKSFMQEKIARSAIGIEWQFDWPK